MMNFRPYVLQDGTDIHTWESREGESHKTRSKESSLGQEDREGAQGRRKGVKGDGDE